MWWDWTGITLFDSVLFSLVSLIVLYLVGSGILKLTCALSKKTDPFSSFDFLQKTNFRIMFGFIFIFLFVFIFSIFDLSFLVSTLLIIALAVIGLVTSFRSFKLRVPRKPHFQNYVFIMIIIVIVTLVVTIFLSSMLITGFYGSTNDDGAFHTSLVRIILDQPNALLTRSAEPYGNFIIIYPLATHALSAFFVTMLGVSIQKIVIMISVILPSLIALSFYSTLKCLFGRKVLSIVGLIVAAFFTIGLSWAPISWGGLPVLLSLYISISGMGLIFVFLLKNKMTWLNAALLGLIFFIGSQTYPDILLVLSLWFVLILTMKVLSKLRNFHEWTVPSSFLFSRKDVTNIIAFLIPMLLSIPYFYSIFSNHIGSSQFITLSPATNSLAEVVKARIGFNWLFDIPRLSFFFSEFGKLLALAPCSLILLILLFIPQVSQRIASFFPSREFARSLFLVYFFMLMIMSYLTLTLYLPLNFLTALLDPTRVWQHLFIPATILTAVVIFSAIYFSYQAFKRLFHSGKMNTLKLNKKRMSACALLALLIFSIVVLSFPIIRDQQVQYDNLGPVLNTYETLNQSDIILMNWIKTNIPSNENILVSSGDSGQFLTAVTQRQTVSYDFGLENYNDSLPLLMTLLTSNASDLKAVPLLVEYNVSYVYIGSIATTYGLQNPYYRHFNSTQFLSTPYFTLTKEVGDAWLFQFNASAALTEYNT